uniref:AAA+ ATPase domain-containing protein n=1 Tax=Polysiphonia sertularioides TaxID=945028 RepID=A0A1Z1MGL8_9FLOR|nr:hypothetical protein [Polysiphonia sertularioides]
MLIADDLDSLLDILPSFVRNPLMKHPQKKLLVEVVMDLGRRPEARFPGTQEYVSIDNISWHDLDFCIKKIPQFSGDNRSGIECTLHRVSSIKNRKGNIIGLTLRVGRAIFGTIGIIRDLLYKDRSLLLLGKPGVGKTTAIREISRVLADEMQKRVVIIDTSNEIAGDGDIPHPAIGRARRMQVSRPELQHQVMIEAVENHMPEVIIIDEIGTELEALAARTIAERGVQLVGTAHGNCLDSLIRNPILCDLIGGIQYVTLGDDEAKRRGSQKSILERKSSSAFHSAIEINERTSWIIHDKVEEVVDKILKGSPNLLQRRKYNEDGSIVVECESDTISFTKNQNLSIINKNHNTNTEATTSIKDLSRSIGNFSHLKTSTYNIKSAFANYNEDKKLYVYCLNIQQVECAIKNLNISLVLTRDLVKADFILGLKSTIKYSSKIRQFARSKNILIYTVNSHSLNSINRALKQVINTSNFFITSLNSLCFRKKAIELDSLIEVKLAIEIIVLQFNQSVELLPRNNNLISLQIRLIELYNLSYTILSCDEDQKVLIYPN